VTFTETSLLLVKVSIVELGLYPTHVNAIYTVYMP